MRVFILLASLSGCSLIPPGHDVYIPTPISCVTWEPVRSTDSFTSDALSRPIWEQVQDLLHDRAEDRRFIDGQQAVIQGCK